MRIFSKFAAFALISLAANAQQKSDKFAVFVTGLDAAAPVAQSLIKQLNASKPFEAVGKNDSSKVVVLITCLEHKQTEPFVCMYVSHYNGVAFKTFLGGGLQIGMAADGVATSFLSSVTEDIVERFNDTDTTNLREALEACVLMTDGKCNVPVPLQKEFGTQPITLGQFLVNKR